MKTSQDGRHFIETFEGLFLRTYADAVGHLTIGYGHTSEAGPPRVFLGMSITAGEADQILSDDLSAVEKNVTECISIPLQQYEFDALVSFDFNTGKLAQSTIRQKINGGDKTAAMKTLLMYDHAGGRVLSGLTRRRNAEKLMFEGKVQPALNLAGYHAQVRIPTASGEAHAPVPAPPDIPKQEERPYQSFYVQLFKFVLSLFKRS